MLRPSLPAKNMSNYFEIAYAAASGRICLFTGTGFSKAVTANAAPNWQGLLEALCPLLGSPQGDQLKLALFPTGRPPPLPLEEAAQIIDIELRKVGRTSHEEIANIIRALAPIGDNSPIMEFLQTNRDGGDTTNYSKKFEPH